MSVDKGNLLIIVMGVERYILTNCSYGVEIKLNCFVILGLGSVGCRRRKSTIVMSVERYILTSSSHGVEIKIEL